MHALALAYTASEGEQALALSQTNSRLAYPQTSGASATSTPRTVLCAARTRGSLIRLMQRRRRSHRQAAHRRVYLMEEGPSSSSGFSTRATAPLQEPPVSLVHSIIPVDEEDPARGTQWGWWRCLYVDCGSRCFSIPCEADRRMNKRQ
jgi:hypothetical protein